MMGPSLHIGLAGGGIRHLTRLNQMASRFDRWLGFAGHMNRLVVAV